MQPPTQLVTNFVIFSLQDELVTQANTHTYEKILMSDKWIYICDLKDTESLTPCKVTYADTCGYFDCQSWNIVMNNLFTQKKTVT